VEVSNLSFAAQVIASLIAGAICGLFSGEKAQILAPIGDIFIKLIQIAIVPSIIIFIITGIPAIVLFCLLFGFSLIGDERYKPFVDLLKGLSTTLSKITKLLIKAAPLGIFAITANTAGTITIEQFLQIQLFFTSTVVLSVILVLLALPLLVYCLTPLSYRKILSAANL